MKTMKKKCYVCKVWNKGACAFEHNGDDDICPFDCEYLDLSGHDTKLRTDVIDEVIHHLDNARVNCHEDYVDGIYFGTVKGEKIMIYIYIYDNAMVFDGSNLSRQIVRELVEIIIKNKLKHTINEDRKEVVVYGTHAMLYSILFKILQISCYDIIVR